MTRLDRIRFFTLLQLFLCSRNFVRSQEYTCSYVNNANWCTVDNLVNPADGAFSKVNFPNSSQIYLKDPKIDYLSLALMNRMITVDKLEVDGGIVPKIYIKPTLTRISAHKNQAREVIIEPEDNYYLEHLGIAYNQIRSVPKNLNKLKSLIRLHLHDNQIETINMDQFKDLNKLKVLALHRNQIHRLDTTVPLKLTNLAELFLYGNQLQDLYVNLWDFPNLETLHLAANKFRSIGRFPGHFPKLGITSLGSNAWNCAWLVRSLMDVLKQGKLKVGGDKQCLDQKFAGVCCDGAADDFGLFLMESSGDQFQRLNVWMIRQERRLDELEDLVKGMKDGWMEDRLLVEKRLNEVKLEVESLKDSVAEDFEGVRFDLQRIERKSPQQVLEQFEWFRKELGLNRALIDDVVQELYVVELKKHEMK